MLKKNRNQIILRWFDAACNSIQGLSAAWRNETAFRQELLLLLILLPTACWLGTTAVQRALLIFSLMAILAVELLNSAIEAVVDRIGSDYHLLSGQAKNMGSAAVLIALINAAIMWGFVAWERWS